MTAWTTRVLPPLEYPEDRDYERMYNREFSKKFGGGNIVRAVSAQIRISVMYEGRNELGADNPKKIY